jgi:hypothetical protein
LVNEFGVVRMQRQAHGALLGHKTATLTLDRYGHLFPDDPGKIADAFDVAAKTAADDLRTIPVLRAVPSEPHSV